MTDFNEIADVVMGAITKPKNLSPGHWRGRINSGTFKLINGEGEGGGNTPIAKSFFSIKALEAIEVNDALLEELGPLDDVSPVYHEIKAWDRRGYWPMRRFLSNLGIEFTETEQLADVCKRAKGYMVTFTTEHSYNKKDPENPYVNVTDIQVG